MLQPAFALSSSPALRFVLGFVAAFVATLTFRQIGILMLHLLGITPAMPWVSKPVPPFGAPQVISLAFWGGVWGLVYGAAERYFPQGILYYVVAFLFGAIVVDLVLWFVVFPLKGRPMAAGWNGIEMLKHVFMHGSFGLGIGLLLTYRDGRLQMLRA